MKPVVPQTKAEILTNFPLKDMEKTFNYAVFERKISRNRVREIATAIEKGNFFDNIIKVTQGKKAKYDVIDGQHRLEAFKLLRDEKKLSHYDFILYVYLDANPRDVYRRLNLGRALTLGDHLKAIDNGRQQFFNKLRDYCDHGNTGVKLSYVQAVNCIHYAKTGNSKTLKSISVDDFLNRVTEEDFKFARLFFETINNMVPEKNSEIYWFSIFRNLYRICFENNLSAKNIETFVDAVQRSKKIFDLADERSHKAVPQIYGYMTNTLGPRTGLKLKKHKDITELEY